MASALKQVFHAQQHTHLLRARSILAALGVAVA